MKKNNNKIVNHAENSAKVKFNAEEWSVNIQQTIVKSSMSFLVIGEMLYKAKNVAKDSGEMISYNSMFKNEVKSEKYKGVTLSITKKTADKFIAIYEDEMIQKYKSHLPLSWTTIYDLRGKTDEQWNNLLFHGLSADSTAKWIKDILEDKDKSGSEDAQNVGNDEGNTKDYKGSDNKSILDGLKTNESSEEDKTDVTSQEDNTDESDNDNETANQNKVIEKAVDALTNVKKKKAVINSVNFTVDTSNLSEDALGQYLLSMNSIIKHINSIKQNFEKVYGVESKVDVTEKSLSELGIALEDAISLEESKLVA